MKKILLVIISILAVAFCLCACGKEEPKTEIQTTQTESALPDANLTEVENTNSEKLEKANTFVDKNVDELIAAIGEPESREYTSSCLGDGEDGNLDYGDFWVNTYKENDVEVVKSVNLK